LRCSRRVLLCSPLCGHDRHPVSSASPLTSPIRRSTGSGSWAEPAACAHPHAWTQVVLTVPATGRVAAKVIVHDGVAWMEPAVMAANLSGEIYVLWQITGSHPRCRPARSACGQARTHPSGSAPWQRHTPALQPSRSAWSTPGHPGRSLGQGGARPGLL